MNRSAAVWIGLWALALVALVHGIGSVALMDPDEGRNAEVAREMAERNDYVVPHLGGLPYLDKPVLFFASAALAIEVLGATELAVRLPSLLATVATLCCLVAFGWNTFGRRPAALAGLIFITSPLVVGFAHIVIFDSLLMFCVSAACIAFFFAWESGSPRWWIAAWAAMGFGALTKGPVALALPLSINIAYAWSRGEHARRLFHPGGLVVFSAVVAPWFIAVSARHPDFPHYAFIRETFERVTTQHMDRAGPIHYFIPLLIGGAAPWILLLMNGATRFRESWRERRGTGRTTVYLVLWICVPLVLFSLSQSKRPGYILPVFPALALLCAHAFHSWPIVRRRAAWASLGLIGAALIGFILGVGDVMERIRLPEIARAVHTSVPFIGASLFVCVLAISAALRFRAPLALIAGFGLLVPLIALSGHGVAAALGENRSARMIGVAMRNAGLADARVIGIESYPTSLAFYLERPILLATRDGSGLKSNYISDRYATLRLAPNTPLRAWHWWRSEFEQCSEPTVFVLKSRTLKHYPELTSALPVVSDNGRFAALGPCAPDRS